MTDTTMPATTILSLAGVVLTPPVLSDTTLILIDYQNEYLSGPLALVGADAALERAAILLQAARAAGTRIIHVAHRGEAGDLFDRGAFRGAFIPAVAPVEGAEGRRPDADRRQELRAPEDVARERARRARRRRAGAAHPDA